MPASDAGSDAAPAADASVHPVVGTWEFTGTTRAPRLGAPDVAVMGTMRARVTFRPDGRLEASAEMTVDGCVVRMESALASYRLPGAEVIIITGRNCLDTDTSDCAVRTARPETPGLESYCQMLDSTLVRNTNGEWSITDAGLSINRSAPFTRAQ